MLKSIFIIMFTLLCNDLNAQTTWINSNLELLEKSSAAHEIDKKIQALKSQKIAEKSTQPFTFNSSLNQTLFEADPDLNLGLRNSQSFLMKHDIKYETPETLSLQLSLKNGKDSLQQPTNYSEFSEPRSIELSLSYDIARGGDSSLQNLTIKSKEKNIDQSFYYELSRKNDLRIRYYNLLVDLFSLQCKKAEITDLEKFVNEALIEGEHKFKNRIISYKDFLNYKDLSLSFERKKIELLNDEQTLISQISNFNEDTTENLKNNLSQAMQECQAFTNQNLSEKINLIKNKIDLNKIASIKSAASRLSNSELQIEILKTKDKYSINPFITLQNSRESYSSKNSLSSVTFGVSFNWNFNEESKKLYLNAANEHITSSKAQLRQDILTFKSKTLQIKSQIKSQLQLIEVVKKSIETNTELSKILDTQRKIGQTDTLNYSNSFLNQFTYKTSHLDLLASIHKSIYELQIYQNEQIE